MQEQIVVKVLSSLILGFLFAFPGAFVFNYFRTLIYVPRNKAKILEKAIADGHVVKGKLIDAREQLGDQDLPVPNGKWYSVYRYEYKGKTHQYKGVIAGSPPSELDLYFESDPSKACTLNELGFRETRWMNYYRPMAIVYFIVIFIYETLKHLSLFG